MYWVYYAAILQYIVYGQNVTHTGLGHIFTPQISCCVGSSLLFEIIRYIEWQYDKAGASCPQGWVI